MSQSHSAIQIKAWLESLRLRTLPLTLASIFTGCALAFWQGFFRLDIAIMTLLTAGLLQILSNLANDYGDYVKGSDTPERLGPNRGMQKGLINQQQMRKALIITIVLTIISGTILVILSCQKPVDIAIFLSLGLIAIIAAITYTIGNKPYGYIGLGDISVLVFFGWLSIGGCYYLQANSFNEIILLPATACGLLSTAVLNINNLRDIEQDRSNGKNTLAVRLGPLWARRYHCLLITSALLCLFLFTIIYTKGWQAWLFVLVVPLLYRHTTYVLYQPSATAMKPMLENMVKIALITNLLFSIGIIFS